MIARNRYMTPTVELDFPARSTPFPNVLLDEIMPQLTDSEWRLLCVIVRQTLGWQVKGTGRRRSRDWLTQSQFRARTGRESSAISKAIESLVRQFLIEVTTEEGFRLNSARERRRYRGRLFFCLHSRLLGQGVGINQEPNSESEHQKANTTKDTYTK